MKLNWIVRLKNPIFWTTAIPAVCLFVQSMGKALGIEIDLTETQTNLVNFINVAFALLAGLGVLVDTTTQGIRDSQRAMTYTDPSDSDALSALESVFVDD